MKRAIMVVGLVLGAYACQGIGEVRSDDDTFVDRRPAQTRPVPKSGLPAIDYSEVARRESLWARTSPVWSLPLGPGLPSLDDVADLYRDQFLTRVEARRLALYLFLPVLEAQQFGAGAAFASRVPPVQLPPARKEGAKEGAEAAAAQGASPPPFVHSVIFYLKKGAPENAAAKMIEDSHTLLARIPSVKGVWAGRPSKQSTPKFAVTDYQVGLLVLFENAAGLKTYLEHELHTEYVNRHEKHIDRVLVYDFENQKAVE